MIFLRVFIIFGLLTGFPSFADDVDKKEKELLGLQKQINQINQSLRDLRLQKNTLQDELKQLELEYGQSVTELKQLEQRITKESLILKNLKTKIVESQANIVYQLKGLSDLLRSAFISGRNEKIKLLLNQEISDVSSRMLIYFDYVNQDRVERLNRVKRDVEQLSLLKEQHIETRTFLNTQYLASQNKRTQILEAKKQRSRLLANINHDFQNKSIRLKQFKENAQALRHLIDSLRKALEKFPMDEGVIQPFDKLKGKLPWPVKGRIVKKFGTRRAGSRWDGVLIRGREGREIRAIARGRIVYSDWLRGYGLLSIIDHGEGYMSLYAFNESLYKSIGDWVEPGTVIATVGQSGGQTETGLYFGIRVKGKPVNPVKWCRKRQ